MLGEFMQSAFAIIIVFGGLIFIHELGHFLLARLFGIGVRSFSIGFGPKLIAKTIGNTEYRLSVFPLGGYVALVGEEETAELPEGFTPKESFALRPAWQRLCVVVAGATFNILLAILIYCSIFYFVGKSYLLPVIGSVTPNSPANMAQLEAGDTILRINNIPITRFEQVRELTQINAGDKMTLVVANTAGEERTVEITPIHSTMQDIFGDTTQAWILGITPTNKEGRQQIGFFASIEAGVVQTYNALELTVIGLGKLIQGKVSTDSVGGPIMIAQVIHDGTKQGIVVVASIAAFISINLGFINLLPIPVLDGGHAVFLLLEMIRKKPVSIEWRDRFTKVGLALLFSLMIFAMYNDIFRLFKQ